MRRLPPARSGLRLLTGKAGIVVIAALALAAMAGTALILGGRSDNDEPEGASPGLDAPAGQRSRTPVGTFFRAKALAVEGIRPPGWRLASSRRAVRLAGPRRSGIVAVSAAPRSVSARALMTSTIEALRRSYKMAKLSKRRTVQLGGQRGLAISGSATNSRGVRLDLLVSTAQGRERTYLLQAFVARASADARQAQALVDSLELSG